MINFAHVGTYIHNKYSHTSCPRQKEKKTILNFAFFKQLRYYIAHHSQNLKRAWSKENFQLINSWHGTQISQWAKIISERVLFYALISTRYLQVTKFKKYKTWDPLYIVIVLSCPLIGSLSSSKQLEPDFGGTRIWTS